MERFAPSIRLQTGETVQPPGWMWILAFASGGCQWAIDQAKTPEFKEQARDWFRQRSIYRLEQLKEQHEAEIAAINHRLKDL